MPNPIPTIVFAGGRIDGAFAETVQTNVKALVRIGEVTMLETVLRALQACESVGEVLVVGPQEIRDVLGSAKFILEAGSAVGNLEAGLRAMAAVDRVLLCGSDLPFLTEDALSDFLLRSPEDAQCAMPVVTRLDFEAVFSAAPNIYVPLAEGPVTVGSQFLIRPDALLQRIPLLRSLFKKRKSQIAMATTLGPSFIFKLLTRRLTIPVIEKRMSDIGGCACRAVLGCRPELGFDIDNLQSYTFAVSFKSRTA